MSQGSEAGVPQAEQLAVAVVAVDRKLYWRDPVLGTWSWTANTAAQDGQATFSPDTLGLTGFDGLNFVALRKEVLGGITTTHWHADLDLAALLAAESGAVPPDPATRLPQLTAAVDLWIGDADGYLHRIDFAVAMKVADAGGPAVTLDVSFALTLSNFDRPVTIVAPAGAVPAATDPTSVAPASALAGMLPSGVGSSLSALPLGAGGANLSGLGGFGGASVARASGQPAASARPETVASAVKPTPRPSTNPSAPTAMVARAANVVTGSGGPLPSAVPAAGALEATPTVLAASDENRMLVFLVGIGVLLVAALGLMMFGWRSSRR